MGQKSATQEPLKSGQTTLKAPPSWFCQRWQDSSESSSKGLRSESGPLLEYLSYLLWFDHVHSAISRLADLQNRVLSKLLTLPCHVMPCSHNASGRFLLDAVQMLGLCLWTFQLPINVYSLFCNGNQKRKKRSKSKPSSPSQSLSDQ